MRAFSKMLLAASAGLALATASNAVHAETPDDTLVVALRIDDIITMDPAESFEFATADVNRNIYQKLVNFDPLNLEAGYQPEIAESWSISNDGRTLTFNIREGLKFESGNPVTAEDVEFSLRRAVLLNKTPAFILKQLGLTADNVAETIKAEGNTVAITTDRRYATSFVLNCLTATVGGIVDKLTAMEHEIDGDMGNEWLKTNSAGSGPYKLTGWIPNESVDLTANPNFHLGEPAMKRVLLRHVQESANQHRLLERGDIDVARNLNSHDVKTVRNTDGLRIIEELRGRLMYFSLNQKHPELSKPEVRQAVKYLVDYRGMESSFLDGQYVVHQNFLPKTFPGAATENPFSLNVEKAKALLAEADVDGLELEVGVRDAQDRVEIAETLKTTFAKAGIKLSITVGPAKQILGRYRARDLDVYLGAWGPDYPDPHTNAGTFAYNPDNSDAANATGLLTWRNSWDTGGLSEKTAAALVENDRNARAELYGEIQAAFREISPFAVMFQKIEQAGLRNAVQNLNLGGATTAASYWPVTKSGNQN